MAAPAAALAQAPAPVTAARGPAPRMTDISEPLTRLGAPGGLDWGFLYATCVPTSAVSAAAATRRERTSQLQGPAGMPATAADASRLAMLVARISRPAGAFPGVSHPPVYMNVSLPAAPNCMHDVHAGGSLLACT